MLSSDSPNLISLRVNRSICYHFTCRVSPNSTLKTYMAGADGTISPLLPWQLRYRCVLHYVSSGGKGRRPANQSCALESLMWLGLNFPLESTCAALRPAADHKYSHRLLEDQSHCIFLSLCSGTVQVSIFGSS